MTRIEVETVLPLSADRAAALARRAATFEYVVWPVLRFRGLPATLAEGERASARLWLFLCVPGWRHHIRIVGLDRLEIRTHEHGGPVRTWNHTLRFEPRSRSSCRYTDIIAIDAGALTPLVAALTRAFFGYRQARWRRLTNLIEPALR
jgi:hypothetical protein